MKFFKFSLMTPINLSYWWNLGSLLGGLMLIQIISGFMLSFYYENSSMSFDSIWIIHLEVFYGSIFHYIHLNFASFIFFILYIHLMKGILFNSFLFLKLVWVSGWILLFMLMMTAFLGYVLPWGQMSLWGATVITNLISVFPSGMELVKWIWSGYFVSIFTMKVFFSLHFILPFIILVLIITHITLLHYSGSSNPLGGHSMLNKQEFIPVFLVKDLLNMVIIFLMLMFLCFYPFILGDSENFIKANPLVSPIHIQPEWYFLQYYGILRAIPSKLGGVVFFILSLFMILMVIFIKQSSTNMFKLNMCMNFMFFNMNIILMWLGSCPVEYPYLALSQIFSVFYFFWFLKIFFILMIL